MGDQLKSDIAALLPRLRRFALALSGAQEEADDVVQMACVKALSNLDKFTPGTRLDSWMYRIVQNCWRDHLRAGRRRAHDGSEALERLSDDGLGARRAESRMALETVLLHISALPEEQRLVLALVTIEGLSYQETADIVGAPIGTVMSRLARARGKLLASMGAAMKGDVL